MIHPAQTSIAVPGDRPRKESSLSAFRGNFLTASADELERLAGLLREAATLGTSRQLDQVLMTAGELTKVTEEVRERAILAALKQRRLTMREIGRMVGLSAPQILARARAAGIDTSKPPRHPGRR